MPVWFAKAPLLAEYSFFGQMGVEQEQSLALPHVDQIFLASLFDLATVWEAMQVTHPELVLQRLKRKETSQRKRKQGSQTRVEELHWPGCGFYNPSQIDQFCKSRQFWRAHFSFTVLH